MSNPMLFLAPLNGSLAFQDRAGGGSLTGSGAVRYAPASGARINYFPNPVARNNATGFGGAGTGTTVNRITTDDTYPTCVEVATNGGGTYRGLLMSPGNMGNYADSLTSVTVSFWFKHVSGDSTYSFQPFAIGAGGSAVSGSIAETAFTGDTTWTRKSFTFTPLHGAHYLTGYIWQPTAAASTFRVWGVQFEESSAATELIDAGSGSGAVWLDPITGILGTAHASPSVSQACLWGDESTTNLLLNPSGENAALTGLTAVSSATVTRDSTYAYIGTYAVKIVTPGSVSGEGVNITSASSLGYTGSIKTFTASVYLRGAGSVNVYAFARYTDGTFENLAGTTKSTVSLTDKWTRVTPGSISTNSAKTVDYVAITIRTSGTQATTFYADAAQVEEKAYATSYADGSIGTGYAWSGTAHASSSTRTRLDYEGIIAGLRTTGGHVAIRIKDLGGHTVPAFMDGGGYEAGEFGWSLYTFTDGTTDDWFDLGYDNSDYAAVSSGAVTRDTWLLKEGWWSFPQDRIGMSIDGTDETDDSANPFNWADPAVACAGAFSGGAGSGQFLLGPIAIFDRPLTANERATLNARTSWGWSTLKGGKPGLLLPI